MYKDFSVSFPPVWIKILKFERVSELQWGELRSSPHEYRLGAEYEISWRSQVKKRHGIIKEGRNKIGKGGGKFDFILTFVDRMRTIAKRRREKKKKRQQWLLEGATWKRDLIHLLHWFIVNWLKLGISTKMFYESTNAGTKIFMWSDKAV